MKKVASLLIALGLTMSGGVPAMAQDDNTPPAFVDVEWQIAHYNGGDPQFGWFSAYEAFDPANDIAFELDIIWITVTVFDPDFDGEEGDGVHYTNQTLWLPYPGYVAPEPPPIANDRFLFFPQEEGLKPPEGTTLTFEFFFQVPPFAGKNQARLRGLIDYDVEWLLRIIISNTEDPGCSSGVRGLVGPPCEEAVDIWDQTFRAIENPVLAAPNPPPFADAGADRTVPAGVEVILDGSRTLDNFNQGFNVASEDIFEKDQLTYTWEWISGPARVDPIQADPADPVATVYLDIPNDPSDPNDLYYEYRLTVDDNVNALPSTDAVRITVVDELPEKNPPVAIIEGPASARPVGSIITLVSRSYDPDRLDDPNGVLLEYRWQQTNELGGPLDPDELQDAFQPLGGMTEKTSSWQALTAGTFYFRLLVDDDDFRSNARFSVEVIDTETGGAMETAGDSPSGSGATGESGAGEQGLTGSAGCGAGILPLAVAPLAMCVLRRRR